MPSTQEEWRKIAYDYEQQWNFNHCIGSLDGKHIVIQSPMNSGSEFYNYKQYFSIVLMVLVDANYCFLFVDCGSQGRLSDGAVFRNSELYRRIEENQIHFPPDEPLVEGGPPLPYVFVGDDAFGLSNRIMKPYPGLHDKGSKERVFNYRLSRARRVVENVFGIMASVFRVLRKPMLLQPDKAALITMTCAYLHNFLRKSKTSSNYTPLDAFDSEKEGEITLGSWRQDSEGISSLQPLRRMPRRSKPEAKNIRDNFRDFCVTDGKLEWQNRYC